jgi:hypothetical protein
MVEPQIVVLVVAGSSPVGHPALDGEKREVISERFPEFDSTSILTSHVSLITSETVPVAQLDRASDFGSEGWGFESLQARGLFRRSKPRITRM